MATRQFYHKRHIRAKCIHFAPIRFIVWVLRRRGQLYTREGRTNMFTFFTGYNNIRTYDCVTNKTSVCIRVDAVLRLAKRTDACAPPSPYSNNLIFIPQLKILGLIFAFCFLFLPLIKCPNILLRSEDKQQRIHSF